MLRRFDRMTMSASIEGRVPFCDQHVMEFANSLPPKLKANQKSLKFVLKKMAEKYLPRELIYRKKMGFSLPIGKWFSTRSELKKKLSFLQENEFLDKNIVNPDKSLTWWNEGNHNQQEFADIAWPLISYEMWHKKFIG